MASYIAKLRFFLVPSPSVHDPRPKPVEQSAISFWTSEAKAEEQARKILSEQGFDIRSIGFAPDPDPTKPHNLVAYVTKKAA